MTLMIATPLLLALAGFGLQQAQIPVWPEAPSEAPVRGRIFGSDGTVLAEGSVDHRRYPQGLLAAHLIGFSGAVQPDGRYGLEGLEYTLDTRLQQGEDVRLTVDPGLQAAAESKLREAVITSQAENGAVVILEAGSGRILASASYPDFDPNRSTTYRQSSLQNRAFLQLYEPGSVMKPFVIAALMQSGRLGPNEIVPAEMTLRVGDKTFADVVKHGPELSVRDVLAYSSNTAMIHLSERFSAEELHAWLRFFGFGQEIHLPASFTRTGILNPWQRWVPQDQASVTIGQSISTTALQLAAAYSIFANDGMFIPPRLVEDYPQAASHRILSPEVALALRSMLVHTVESSSLRQSKIPGITVAGKTGTADIFDQETGRYLEGEYTLSFAGIFPAEAPRVTMVVYLQKPKDGSTSTYVAAPLFRAIGSEVVARLGMSPDPAVTLAGTP